MKILLFGDVLGVRTLLPFLPAGTPAGIVGAGNRPQYHAELAALAAELGVPFQVQLSQTSPEYSTFERFVVTPPPDLLLCYSYSMILPEAVFASARTAAINIHGGPLPEYRGCSPIQWSIISGDNLAGATMHLMNTKLDGGDILAQERLSIAPTDTWRDVSERVHQTVISLLQANMDNVLAGRLKSLPQDASLAKHWPRRHPVDGQLDFSWSARKIYNHIRALVSPLPSAFYRDPTGREVVLDTFLPLAEVVRLKCAMSPIVVDGVLVRPLPAAPNSALRLELEEAGGVIARAELTDFIDPRSETRAFLSAGKASPERLGRLLSRFCSKELETTLAGVIQ